MDFCNNLTVRTCVSVSWKEGLAIVNFASNPLRLKSLVAAFWNIMKR